MRRYYSKGGGADKMMSDAEKEFKAYNLMRDTMDKERFLKVSYIGLNILTVII